MIRPDQPLTKQQALTLYKKLLLPRRIEERMLMLLRQNKISKWFSGIGQEAIAVGVASALSEDDYLLPMHRNLGLFTMRQVNLYKLFCQLLGKADGFTGGRDRSFHFGIPEKRIVGMISHLAATMPVADGLALASKLRDSGYVAASFCGDGATSEGEFHEALNLAAVWKLPVIFVIENNGYGLSTPTEEQYACKDLVDRAWGYGIGGVKIDGNDIFSVRDAVRKAKKLALKGQPTLIEAKTFRMRGHEEASGTFYVSEDKIKEWKKKDPLLRFEQWLLHEDIISGSDERTDLQAEVDEYFMPVLERALEAEEPEFDRRQQEQRLFAPVAVHDKQPESENVSEKRFVDAIRFSLEQVLEKHEEYLMMGQDIAEYGGVFKVTEGFVNRFGKERIRNTPIIEAGALGCAVGLALEGFKPIVEMQFADFISCGFNQVVNNISKGQYRWMPPLNITIRAPHGAGVGAGPYHSQSPEGWFMQHPGLKIVVPATVEDAQHLLYSALIDPNPVLFFEHKKLYRSIRQVTNDRCIPEELGNARIHRRGSDVSIITYGMGVHWAHSIADQYHKREIEIEIVDLRCLAPLDFATVKESVGKTNRALLLQEPSATLGPMSELSSLLGEQCFEQLDAPIMRCSSLDIPVPFSPALEKHYLAENRLKETLDQLLAY
ncbi:alpha-ketoacid dehydrogenase subunit alpha/beta [Fodinibius sediminis]|uniref:2-oxoisovalerate dehydrogenase E1 component n=1 Tax=Fodinibius sediminis TaxID=1214077 RepID=A0A521B023_9BACT|nr:alpha-ketoacid dehydrogenase subunit alpha/beta [Fodinibius sediminis]SMO40448.1 2-oxoisovalerate dehydrogenase E1 component [Fodinibius sediminis]